MLEERRGCDGRAPFFASALEICWSREPSRDTPISIEGFFIHLDVADREGGDRIMVLELVEGWAERCNVVLLDYVNIGGNTSTELGF
jgi:hypothetical protein